MDISEIEDIRNGDVFRHTFTHFHLDIEPIYIRLTRTATTVHDDDRLLWYRVDSEEIIGLSAPAVKLLATIQEFALT